MKKKLKWIIPIVLAAVLLISCLTQTIRHESILKYEKARAQTLAESFLSGILAGDTQVLNLMRDSGEWSDYRRGYNESKITIIAEDVKSSGADQSAAAELVEFSPMKQEEGTVWFFIASINYKEGYQGIRINGILIPDQEEEYITYLSYWNEENRVEIHMGEDREWIY